MLDKFIQIMEENDLRPEDIEKVKAQPHPMVQFRFAQENTLRTPDDYGFSAPYLFACAAHKISPARWHDVDIKQDPKIQAYMQWLKPRLSVTIDEEDFGLAKLEDSKSFQTRIEVVAKGKSFRAASPHPKGGWHLDQLRNTDEELVRKFIENARRVLPLDKANLLAQTLLQLEKAGNVAHVMDMVTP